MQDISEVGGGYRGSERGLVVGETSNWLNSFSCSRYQDLLHSQ